LQIVPDERLTKNQRRDQARELARKEREKAQRRDRLTKILVPVIVVVVLVAVAVTTTLVIVNQPKPAPVAANGPANMISDGIVFTGQGGKAVVTTTAALKKGETPTPAPTATAATDPVHITTYVDWACPVCKSFEEANFSQIQDLVTSGKAVLEVKPVAIVDRAYTGDRFASRMNNAAACVANYDPDSFLAVEKAAYDNQPAEGSVGLSNKQIVDVVHKGGLNDSKVDACIQGESFKNWITATTQRAENDPTLVAPGSQGFGTPTIIVGSQLYSGSFSDPTVFKAFFDQVAAAQKG
jgi:protein-disulfide isomerase